MASPTTSSSGNTTTTLPQQYSVSNSTPSGASSFVGGVKRVDVGNVQIGFRQFGSGKPMLLIPDRNFSMADWGVDFLTALSQNYSVTEIDLPGVGYSSYSPSQPMTATVLGNYIANFVNDIGLKSPYILGFGYGGSIALQIAETDRNLAKGLILVGSTPGGNGSTPPTSPYGQLLSDGSATSVQLMQALFPQGQSLGLNNYISSVEGFIPEPIPLSTIQMQAQGASTLATDNSIQSNLSKISVPCLVLFGEADRDSTAADANLLASGLSVVTKVVFSNDGHGLLFQDTTKFLTLLSNFIS